MMHWEGIEETWSESIAINDNVRCSCANGKATLWEGRKYCRGGGLMEYCYKQQCTENRNITLKADDRYTAVG